MIHVSNAPRGQVTYLESCRQAAAQINTPQHLPVIQSVAEH